MQLVRQRKAARKGARRRPAAKVSQPVKVAGTRREGAGRPSLHMGKRTDQGVTCYLTPDGWVKMREVQDELLKRNKHLNSVSMSDALEEGIHKLHHELTRPRRS